MSKGHGETDFNERFRDVDSRSFEPPAGATEVLSSDALVESATHEKLTKMMDMLQEHKPSHNATMDVAASMLEEQRGFVSRVAEASILLVDVASIGQDFCKNPSVPSATM